MSLQVRRVALSRVERGSWDELAQAADASYRVAHGNLVAWSAKHALTARLALFQLRLREPDGTTCLVGQCAVGLDRRGGGLFLDRLMLRPEHAERWGEAMSLVLSLLPAGEYTYGFELSLEPPRESDLAALPGVDIHAVRPLTVHSVEFADWDSWEAYHKAVSTNVKRNVKAARTRFPDLQVEERRGYAGFTQVRPLIGLRRQMYARKNLSFRPLSAAVSTLAHLAAGGRESFTAIAVADGQALAAISGAVFGRSCYYLDGGSAPDNGGASWVLLMQVIEEAYRRDPRGRVVMGYVDMAEHDEAVGGGLLRQRRSTRAADVPTSVVTLRWQGIGGIEAAAE